MIVTLPVDVNVALDIVDASGGIEVAPYIGYGGADREAYSSWSE